jgi:hypothetical protein
MSYEQQRQCNSLAKSSTSKLAEGKTDSKTTRSNFADEVDKWNSCG